MKTLIASLLLLPFSLLAANPSFQDVTNIVNALGVGTNVIGTTNYIYTTNITPFNIAVTLTNQNVPEFSVVLIPDTQTYWTQTAQSNRYVSAMERIESRKTDLNIKMVIGLGDIVDNSAITAWWDAAMTGWRKLTIPAVVSIGNHDYDPTLPNATIFNSYVSRSFYTNNSAWSGGFRDPTEQQNLYAFFTNGTSKYMVLSVEFFATAAHMTWASNVVAANPDHFIIFVSHNYLLPSGRRGNYSVGDPYQPQLYGVANVLDPETIWNNYLKHWPKLIMVAGGHQINGPNGQTNTFALGTHGNLVNQVFCNWQYFYTDWSVRQMYLTFYPDGRIVAKTWEEGVHGLDGSTPNIGPSWLVSQEFAMNANSSPVPAKTFLPGAGIAFTSGMDGQQQTISSTGSGGGAGGTNSPYVWLKLNGPSTVMGGTNLIRDYSDYSWPMTGILTSVESGLDGRSSYFDQVGLGNNFADQEKGLWTPGDMNLYGTSNLTVSVWVNTTNAYAETTDPRIFAGKYNSGTYGVFYIGMARTNQGRFTIVNSSAIRGTVDGDFTSTVVDSNWHHLVGTYNGIQMKIYYDRNLIAVTNQTGVFGNASDTFFGVGSTAYGSPVTNSYSAKANLDEVKVWKRTLTADEIYSEYRDGLARIRTAQTNRLILLDLGYGTNRSIIISNGVITLSP